MDDEKIQAKPTKQEIQDALEALPEIQNELVADFCIDQISVQVQQHQGYIEKLTTLPTPIDRPEYLNKDSYTYDISNLL